jgi:hypothetical protein
MMEPTQDLSDGDDVSTSMSEVANVVLSEQLTRRWFRGLALGAAMVTLAVLLWALGSVVCTFTSEFRALALNAKVDLTASQLGAIQALPAPVAARTASDAAPTPAAEPVRAAVSLGSFTTSLVALVSAFVLAVTVLAIALVRASFTLTARGDEPRTSASPKTDDPGITLPTIEFVKAFGEAMQTALKGVQGLAKTGD